MASNIKSCHQIAAAAAAEIIGGNYDLVVEILLRLPAKSLIRFKSVCKTWRSLLSSRRFSLLWQFQHRGHPKISSLLFSCLSRSEIKCIPLNINNGGQNKSLILSPNTHTIILDSCNGFLLCSSTKPGYDSNRACIFHVYNPTTNQSYTLPWPFRNTCYPVHPLNLVFDPSKSLHYKVVLLQRLPKYLKDDYFYQIHIYSSETNAWRAIGFPFSSKAVYFNNTVYCNGSVHWISSYSDEASVYFDVDRERLCSMPTPPYRVASVFQHFADCRGHLHLTEYSHYDGRIFSVGVSEMESDYSKWSLKYWVNLNAMVDFVSQEMIVRDKVSVLGLIDGEDEGDLFLVLFVGTNMIISYNIKDNTFKKLHDVAHHPTSSSAVLSCFKHCFVHPYTETLFSI